MFGRRVGLLHGCECRRKARWSQRTGRPAAIFPLHFSASHFSAIPFFAFFRFFCYHRKFSVCQTGMARAFSPYLPRRAHFTWGVAPGWYRSGLWPLLSLFSDQCANGAPYTTVEQRRTKGRPHVTFDDKRAEGPPYHCSTFPDSCARGRAGSRRDRFSNAPAAARQSFLPPFFCHPFFCHCFLFFPTIRLPLRLNCRNVTWRFSNIFLL